MKKWIIYILALLFLGACTNDEQFIPDDRQPNGGESGVTISLKFPQSSPGTYAFTEAQENRINSLEILVFTGGGSANALDDKFAYSIKVPAGGITDSVGGASVNGNIKKVPVKLKSMKDKQRLILLANKPTDINLSTSDTAVGARLGDIIDKLKFSGSPWRKDNLGSSDPAFPMWGQQTDSIQFHSANSSSPSKIEINMMRALARIEVGVDLNGSDPALGFGRVFKIDSIYLCNSTDSGYMAPHLDYLKSKPANSSLPGVTSIIVDKPNQAVKRINYVGYKFANNQSAMLRTIYTSESDSLKGDYKPAFLIVKANYYDENFYYRIDFAENGKYNALLRNNTYLINIVGVRAQGYKQLHDAFMSPVSIHNYSLMLDDSDLLINEVITNEQYMLGYSSSHILLDWNESLSIPIKTDYSLGWTASATGDHTFTNKTGAGGSITYLTDNTLGNNTTGIPKQFTIHLSAGSLKKNITVIQGTGSNSYMVTPGGSIQIPVSSANQAGDRLGSFSDYKVDILWRNGATISLGSPTTNLGKSSLLNIIAGSSQGNAVVTLSRANVIIWSWHIWVTTNVTTTLSNNGYVFMDRNLGATGTGGTSSYGLYYQWGRKDPLITGSATDFPASNNLNNAINNPDIFYIPITHPYDWTGTTQNNNLWNTTSGEKSPYDPCPFGWRVPVVNSEATSPWAGFTTNSRNGITFSLAGGLMMNNGRLAEAGTQGYIWSGSANDTQATVFRFTGSSADHTKVYRANAYPVRCVKDVKKP